MAVTNQVLRLKLNIGNNSIGERPAEKSKLLISDSEFGLLKSNLKFNIEKDDRSHSASEAEL